MLFNILAICMCVVATALFIWNRLYDGNEFSVITKTVASFLFVVAGLVAYTKTSIEADKLIFIPIGLICGLIGDIILELKVVYPIDKKAYFNTGTGFFSLGHICYALAICFIAAQYTSVVAPIFISLGIGLVLAAITMLLSDKLNINFGDCFWQCYGYAILLNTMVALTVYLTVVNMMFIYLAIGMTLFLLSDLILSIQYFGGKEYSKIHSLLNLVLYYAAQIMIVAFLMFA